MNPPREQHKGEDGHYVDIAAEKAKALAIEVAGDISSLFPHVVLLLQGEQKQSFAFGRQLALKLEDVTDLINISFENILVVEPQNTSFILGIYHGIFEHSPETWQANIDRLLADERLVAFYPTFIRTGNIQKSHLDVLLNLIRKDIVFANSANALSYGSVTDSVEPETVAEFCLSLAELGDKASWPALNIIYMYCFGNEGSIEKIRNPLKILVTSVPLHKDQPEVETDIYHWHDMSEKLLKVRDEELAIALTSQLITACQYGFNHGDIWNYTKPLLTELMRDYGNVLWPLFGNAIIQAQGTELYWLKQLLDRENSFSNQMPSVLSVVPVDSVINWCAELPELGPSFVANCVNIFDVVEGEQKPSELFIALLEYFGDDERVASALTSNIGARGWSGSLVPYLEADKAALSPLIRHDNRNVSQWVKDYVAYIDRQIEYESTRDEERNLGMY